MTRIFQLLLLLLIIPFISVYGQEKYKGASIYSYLGIGMPVDFRSPDGASMGVSGVAISNQFSTNNSNPALWGNTIFTSASGGLAIRNVNSEDNNGKMQSTLLELNRFQLIVPVSREKVGISVSLMPLTETIYNVNRTITLLPGEVQLDTLQYTLNSKGTGGINRFEVGVGWNINKNLSVGYAPSLIFGVIRHRSDINFLQLTHLEQNHTDKSSYVGFGSRIGLLLKSASLFRKDDFASAGFTLSVPVQLNTRLEKVFENENNRNFLRDRSEFIGSGKDVMPLEAVFGLAYYSNDYLMLTSEILYQNWSGYKNFSGQSEDFLKDRVKFSVGSQYNAFLRPENSILTRFSYRAGVSYDTGYLNLNNTAVQTIMLSAGLGIPSRRTGSTIDINADFGFRGTKSHDLVREKIFALRLSLNLSEMMFIQRRLQ